MGFVPDFDIEFSVFTVLVAICATLWTYCYVAVIRIGIKEKTCGMPIEALAFNFALKKDGEMNRRQSGPMPPDAFRRFLDHVRGRMNEHGARIAVGIADVAPIQDGQGKACNICDFDSICRVESIEGNPYRSVPKVSPKEFRERFENGEERARD